jgi:ABC-type sugar transport system ATPase subunit
VHDAQDGHAVVDIPNLASIRLPVAPAAAKPGDKVAVGIRPEHLRAGGGGDVDVTVQVALTEQLGDETFVYGTLADGETLVVRAPGQHPVRVDQPLRVGLRLADCHLFGSLEQRLTPPMH